MATTYAPSVEVALYVQMMIREHHPRLEGVRVVCLWRRPTPMKHGRPVLADVRIVTGLQSYLLDHAAIARGERPAEDQSPFGLILVSDELWPGLPEEHRRAVIDHQLCHIETDEHGNLALAPHDIEEFQAVVARHGLYTHELESAAAVFRSTHRPRQLALELDAPVEVVPEAPAEEPCADATPGPTTDPAPLEPSLARSPGPAVVPAAVTPLEGQRVAWRVGGSKLRGVVRRILDLDTVEVLRSDGFIADAPAGDLVRVAL